MPISIRRRLFRGVLPLVGLSLLVAVSVSAQEEKTLTPNAHFMSGKLYFNQKVFEKAEREFANAVKGDSTSAEYRAFWATAISEVALARLEATTEIADQAARLEAIRSIEPLLRTASEQFERAMEIDPKKQGDFASENRQHYWVDMYKQADVLLKDKRFEEALEVFKLTTVLDPSDPAGFFQVAYTQSQIGDVRMSVLLAKESRDMASARLEELGDCSQFKSASRKKECRDRRNRMETIIRNVDSFTRSKNAALGDEAFERSTTIDEPAARRAVLDEAITFYGAALEQDPSLEGVRFNLGNTHFEKARSFEKAGDATAAGPEFQKAAEVFLVLADNDSAKVENRRDALYNAASARFAAKDFAGAGPLFKRYIDLVPKEVPAWGQAGVCHLEQGQRLEGVAYITMANALDDKAIETPVGVSVGTVKNLYGGSAAATALADLGEPEQVRTYTDPSDTERVVTTWIWWSKGQARHFLKGDEVGRVEFQPPAAM
jgi:tetratricopeptide (TPR) repeat protein